MKYIDHLLELTNHFTEGIETETTVSSLADILNCSERHVKSVVKLLHGEGAIKWVTHRGRGKKPKLTIQFTRDEILLDQSKEMVRSEQYQDAFSLVDSMGKQVQLKFQKWFAESLGLTLKLDSEVELDILRYPFYETRLVMDPILIVSRHDAHMVQQVFDRLVEYDSMTKELKPSIAHHWESKDGKQWTFYIHKGITFHHGGELTTSDVQSTFNRLMAETELFGNIERMEVYNQTVIQFTLKEVDYLFPRSLASLKASIVPIEIVAGNPERFKIFPVGSGPYRLAHHDENIVRLEVNHSYFSSRPWLDEVHIIKVPSHFGKEANHPFLLNAPNASWKQVKRMEEGSTYITFNCVKEGLFQQKDFREEICKRLQPGEIRNEGLDNEIAATGFITNRSEAVNMNTDKPSGNFSYKGPSLQIAAQQIRPGANHVKAAKDLQIQLQEMGIESTVDVVDLHQMSNEEYLAKYDLFVGGIALGEDHLLSLLTALHSTALTIYPCLDEKMRSIVDENIQKIRSMQDESKRWDIYLEIEEFLKSNYAIIFCNHRFHTVYEPKDNPYANIELDSNGRVDYRKVWKRRIRGGLEMNIRKLNPQDADTYFKIRLEALYNNPEAFGSSYEEEKEQTAAKYKERFQDSASFTFGAFDDSKLVGVITLLKETRIKLRHRTTIVAMYVTPEMRGKGVAKSLMHEAIDKARTLEGIEQIYLTVVSSNVAAKKLYTSLGFEVYGTEKRALKIEQTYLDEDLMVLFLNKLN